MRHESMLHEMIFFQITRVNAVLSEELDGQPESKKREKLHAYFSIFTLEEMIGLHETLELL